MTDPAVWEEFERDPRRPEHAHLRSADTDREIVHRVLIDAFSDGRLDREEFDQRSDAVSASKTLGELPGFVGDLIPASPLGSPVLRRTDVEAKVAAKYRQERRQAVWTFVSVSLVCWVIWVLTSVDDMLRGGTGFPWPLFVMLGTGLHVGGTIVRKEEIMERERRKLEKRALREMQGRRPREQPPG